MAVRYAVVSGSWSSTSTWNGGTLPTSSDDVYSNNFTVTIDQDVTVLSIRNTAQSPAVAGGGFILNGGFTLNSAVNGGAYLLTYTSSATSSINGNITSGTTLAAVNFNSPSGTLNITGDIISNTNSLGGGYGVRVTNTGILNIVGNIYNLQSYGSCLVVDANNTVNITGNITSAAVGPYSGVSLISINSVSTMNITGNVTHNPINSNYGGVIVVNAASTLNITGNVTGGEFASPAIVSYSTSFIKIIGSIISRSPSATGPAITSTNLSAINIFSGPFICSSYGFFPYLVNRMNLIPSVGTYFEFRDETTNGAISPGAIASASRMISPSAVADAPAASNVRFGVTYANGSQTGSCIIPNTASVAYGVNVDNTTGSALLSPSDVWNILTSTLTISGSLGERLKNASTVDTTGQQLTSIT